MEQETLHSEVREIINNYLTGKTKLGKYVDFSLYETIEQIDAYSNSKHISGDTDHLGRPKPFLNVVTAAVNIWFRATDIDRREVKIKARYLKDEMIALAMQIQLQRYMDKHNFGKYLNLWGRTLSKYGSAVSKFVVKDGELHNDVIPWNRLIVDSVNFNAGLVIEKLFLTPAQLRRNTSYNQEAVKELINTASTRKNQDGTQKDNNDDYIELYEVHGEMPLSYITEKEEDDDTYVQQMHVISFQSVKDSTGKDTYKDFTLIKGKEAQSPYHITHLIEEDGRTLGKGAVEYLFDTQWMVNHSQKLLKDMLDQASKMVYQTADANLIGQNVLSNIEHGDIIIHSPNSPVTQLNNQSHDTVSIQNFGTQWKSNGQESIGVTESMLGITPPSGTAWRQTDAILQEAHSLFEMMIENKAIALEEILRTYIIPHLIKTIDTTDEVTTVLNSVDINKLDKQFINSTIAKLEKDYYVETILNQNQVAEQFNPQLVETQIKKQLGQMGNVRSIVPSDIKDVTWKSLIKDFTYDLEIEVSNENSNKKTNLATLTTILQTIVSRQGQPLSAEERLIFNRILQQAGGISPLELAQANLESEDRQQSFQQGQLTQSTKIPKPTELENIVPTGKG